MRISLIHAILVFLTIVQSVSAGWDSFLDFAKDTEKNVVKFSKEVGEKVEDFAKVAGENVVELSKEASEAVVGFANVAGEEVARLAGVVANDVDAVAHKTIEGFKASIADVVFKVQAMEHDIHDDLEAHGISSDRTFDMFSHLASAFVGLLKAEFSEPLPEKQTAAYKGLAVLVAGTLDIVEDGFVKVSALWHMQESDARMRFGIIKAELSRAILITANLFINHPGLLIFLALLLIPEACLLHQLLKISGLMLNIASATAWLQQFWGGDTKEGSFFAVLQSVSVALLLTPVNWFLGPLLRIFGFGALGPVKALGPAAPWVQGELWGGAVKEGSWFAGLQSAGMKITL